MLKMVPEYQQLAQTNPQLAQMMTDPELLKQTLRPEYQQLFRDLEQSGLIGRGGGSDMMGLRAFPQMNRSAPLTSEQIREKYQTSIEQIREMGFEIDDNVLQTLHRFNGNVEMTINFLMQCFVCLTSILGNIRMILFIKSHEASTKGFQKHDLFSSLTHFLFVEGSPTDRFNLESLTGAECYQLLCQLL